MTPKQEAFALAYVETGNASEAYRRAYNAENMSERAIAVEASRLLGHPAVSLKVTSLRKAAEERTGITVDRVLNELGRVAFSDIRDVVHWHEDGVDLIPSNDITADVAATIREVKVSKTTTRGKDDYEQTREQREVKLYDKLRALELIGKHLGVFVERSEVDVNVRVEALQAVASMSPEQLRELAENARA